MRSHFWSLLLIGAGAAILAGCEAYVDTDGPPARVDVDGTPPPNVDIDVKPDAAPAPDSNVDAPSDRPAPNVDVEIHRDPDGARVDVDVKKNP